MEWYEEYLGKPWAPTPNPPESFTCGELVRWIFRKEFGFEALPIPVPDARDLKDCVDAMDPEYFGLKRVMGLAKDKDAVFLSRRHLMDHCGIVVMVGGQMLILHCSQRGGVQLSSLQELEAEGYSRHSYWRCPLACDALPKSSGGAA